MNIRGQIKNGVVVLEPGAVLPEGAVVTVLCEETPSAEGYGRKRRRVALPLVPSDRPGSVSLTADRVAEQLDEADVSA